MVAMVIGGDASLAVVVVAVSMLVLLLYLVPVYNSYNNSNRLVSCDAGDCVVELVDVSCGCLDRAAKATKI